MTRGRRGAIARCGRCGVPDPARALRRGRHRAGRARARRAPVRRRRRARVGARAWTSTSRRPCCEAAGVAVAPWVTVTPRDWADEHDLWRAPHAAGLGLPVFVKPARAGSSVGVTKVKDWSELDAALDVAFAEDDEGARRGGDRRAARSSAACSSARDGGPTRVQRRRRDRDERPASSTTSRPSTSTTALPSSCARRTSPRASSREMQRLAARAFEAIDGSRARPRRLLLHRHRVRGERAQHDARLHADLDVPEVLGRERAWVTPSSSTSCIALGLAATR